VPKAQSSRSAAQRSPALRSSLMFFWPTPASRTAKASSTVRTIIIRDAPLAKATAAVVKARKTSMIATMPVVRDFSLSSPLIDIASGDPASDAETIVWARSWLHLDSYKI
jgi:hypothetical protein